MQHLRGDWDWIRGISRSFAVRTSWIWIIAVPSYVKAISTLRESDGLSFLKSIDLPFSWRLLFYAALAFSFAGLLYRSFCPEIVRKYKSYGEFAQAGETLEHLVRYAGQLKTAQPTEFAGGHQIQIGNRAAITWLDKEALPTIRARYDRPVDTAAATLGFRQVDGEHAIMKVFWAIRDESRLTTPIAIYLSLLLHTFGLSLSTWIALRNILFVITY